MAAVDRSLPLLGDDVFCLAAAGRFTPTVDLSGMGKIQGPTLREGAGQGLVGSSASARAKFPVVFLESISEQADPHGRSEVKLREHRSGGLVWIPVQASVSWMLMKQREEVVRYKYVHLSPRAAGTSAVGNKQLGVHSCGGRLMLLVHTSVSISLL